MDVKEREVHGFSLNKQDLEHLARIENSIREQSVRHTQLTIEAAGLQAQVAGLYEARRQYVLKKASESGIDPSKIQGVQVDKDGAVSVLVSSGEEAVSDEPTVEPQG